MVNQSKVAQAEGRKKKCGVCGAEVINLRIHINSYHSHSTSCLICSKEYKATHSLLTHLKLMHFHQLGYLLPETSEVAQQKRKESPVNSDALRQAIERLRISGLGGEWLYNDEYAVSYDKVNWRPLVVLEIVTPTTLAAVYDRDQVEIPYLKDEQLPDSKCNVETLQRSSRNVCHLATSANHRLTKEANDATFLERNLVLMYSNVNMGILSSTESHISQVARNWWKTIIITIPIYGDKPSTEGRLAEPEGIAKVVIMGDSQLQVFVIPNSPDIDPEAANFVAVRASLAEVNDLTKINFQTALPLSWDFPMWKCNSCRYMSNEEEVMKLHDWFYHKNRYCRVHNTRHGDKYQTFEQFRAHVEGAGRKHCTNQDCSKWFYSNKSLGIHMRKVHVEKKYICPQCAYETKTKNALDQHIASHDANRERIPCGHCELTFLTQGQLNAHCRMKHLQACRTSPTRVNLRRNHSRTSADNAAPNRAEVIARQKEEREKHQREVDRLTQEIVELEEIERNETSEHSSSLAYSAKSSPVPKKKHRRF